MTQVIIIRPTSKELGGAIRDLRRKRRMTIEQLGLTAKIHPTYLSGIERGRRNPSWDKLVDLAHALETPLSSLVRDAEVRTQLAARVQAVRSELGLDRSAEL